MNHLKTLIIDHEKQARENLASHLKSYCPQVQILVNTDHIKEAIPLIHKKIPDLVFLSMEIGDYESLKLLDHLQPFNFQIIISTTDVGFLHQAFPDHSIDYLLKPIEPKQLVGAVEKAGYSGYTRRLQQQIDTLFLVLKSARNEKILIPANDGLNFIDVLDIIHIVGTANYSTFYLDNGEKIMASKNLKHFEDQLPHNLFFRAHQSHLVNIRFIKKIKTQEGNVIELKDGWSVPLARRRKEALIRLLKRV